MRTRPTPRLPAVASCEHRLTGVNPASRRLTKTVEGHHREEEGGGRHEDALWMLLDHSLAVGDHVAPTGIWRLDAQAQEAERSFRHDERPNDHHRVREERADDVWSDLPKD